LIVYGANVNARDSGGFVMVMALKLTDASNTALHMAASQEKQHSAEITEILLRNGAHADERNTQDNSPLHYACQTGQTFVAMLLLDHGAMVGVANVDGDTPLDIAARDGRREVVALLLEHDPSLSGDTRSLRESSKTGRKDVVRLLLDMGVDGTAADPVTGDTALHEACRFVRLEVAEHLLAFGADAYVANSAGETPVSLAEGYPPGAKRDAMLKLIRGVQFRVVLFLPLFSCLREHVCDCVMLSAKSHRLQG
jgi:ankyrin repeat protein